MRRFIYFLNTIEWTTVGAIVAGVATVALALLSASITIVLAVGILGAILELSRYALDIVSDVPYTGDMNDAYATTPQKDFILSLLAQREVTTDLRAHVDSLWETLTKRDASDLINELKALPFSARSSSALSGLAKSFYAVPSHIVNVAMQDARVDNDLMFLVIDEFRGTVYMRQVHGAPGAFNRTRMTARDVRAIADILRTDELGFITLFGQHHGVCGKCGAHLTDERSRDTGFGPECRRQLGIR